MNENSQVNSSDAYDISINKGKQWVFAIGIVLIITSLLILTTFNKQVVPVLIRCATAVALMFGVRWVRYFFIITGFLSGLLNIVNGFKIFEFVGTDGNGMMFPAPSRNIIPYDCYCMIAIGIINIVLAILLVNKKEIKAYYNSIRMKKTMQYIADNASVYNKFANNENQNNYQQDTSDLLEKLNETTIANQNSDNNL